MCLIEMQENSCSDLKRFFTSLPVIKVKNLQFKEKEMTFENMKEK